MLLADQVELLRENLALLRRQEFVLPLMGGLSAIEAHLPIQVTHTPSPRHCEALLHGSGRRWNSPFPKR